MKTRQYFLLAGLTLLALSGCKKENTASTDDGVRMTKHKVVITSPIRNMVIDDDYKWVDGKLKSVHTDMNGTAIDEVYTYDGDNLIETNYDKGTSMWYYTYDSQNRLKTYCNIREGDTIETGEIISWTDDGHVKEYKQHFTDDGMERRHIAEWENGDLVKCTTYTYPDLDTTVSEYEYDQYINVYQGFPLATGISSPWNLANTSSRHNVITDSEAMKYSNNRLIYTGPTDPSGAIKTYSYFTYSDGTGADQVTE